MYVSKHVRCGSVGVLLKWVSVCLPSNVSSTQTVPQFPPSSSHRRPHVALMMFALAQPLLCAAMFDMPLPAPMCPSRLSAVPVLTGGDTSNLLFGKIQRHATLPGSRLSPNPLAAVDDQVPAPPAVALPTLTLTHTLTLALTSHLSPSPGQAGQGAVVTVHDVERTAAGQGQPHRPRP